ncbi:MAG: site-specific DNA-methyltransferase [Treponema sp.]|jgi:site-specific DNA-methyltransferase (adenine-specific)|nr:site-specific DNA-methyltransferase [Treponema sp.]
MEQTHVEAQKREKAQSASLSAPAPDHAQQRRQRLEGLYTADCVAFMAAMPDECVDLVVTSPPYDTLRDYKGYAFEFERVAEGLFRVIKKVRMHDIMIYQKKNTPFMRSNAYTNAFECMFVLSKELKPEKTKTNMWKYAAGLGGTTKRGA